jgi:hypothetical protein
VVDVTWDDTGGGQTYFHLTDQQLKSRDQNSYHVPEDFYGSIRPKADQAFSGSLKSMKGMNQPAVTLTDTASGVDITLESSKGHIYYTLDGSTPGAGNRYTKPIKLTKSGNYVLTAVAAEDGKLSSAYDICSVRIAGGSVSILSAVNTAKNTLRLRPKSENTYQGFEISYATKKNFRNEKTLWITTDTSATISNLKKGTIYYIRARGYEQDAYGNYYYTAYSKTRKVKITK